MSRKTITTEWIPVARLASGLDLRIAAHIIEGTQDGPTVGLTAGIHGDELIPIEVVRQVMAHLGTQDIKGKIVAVPLANPLAFETFTRHTPTDMHNLNRVFPGTSDTWLTDLIAKALVDYLVPDIEVLLDLHSGGAIPTVDYVYVLNNLELSRSFLFPTLYQGSSYPGSLGTYLIEEKELPVVVAEIGGGGQYDEAYLERGVSGVLNALRHLGMLPGEQVKAPKQTLLTKMKILRPHHGGILHPEVHADRLGESVAEGTRLGHVRDAQTFEELEAFYAPFADTHLVLLRSVLSKVHPGDYAYMLSDLSTAKHLQAQ